ncbi:ATP-binding protein [Streptomyces sp. V4I23]|uniref:ATP-binding protein n=1 Tax=Streptomyces sp. V4I23 TaxID=3042282 RepID=UPI0027D8AA85|nr:ATP-binding protein [Streptomyces sp. V4I23]
MPTPNSPGRHEAADDEPRSVRTPGRRGACRRSEYTCPLPHIPETVRTTRHRARTVLGGWAIPAATADDAVLVIAELVTNAIAHALPPAVLRLSLPVGGSRRALRVEVTDCGPALTAGSAPADAGSGLAECGRGGGIVGALALQHGLFYRAARVTRWADLPVAA